MTDGWITTTRTLAERAGADLSKELAAIRAHADRPGARVAIVAGTPADRVRLAAGLAGRVGLPAAASGEIPVLIESGPADTLEAETEAGRVKLASDGPTLAPGATAIRLRLAAGGLLPDGVELLAAPLDDAGAVASADAAVVPVLATAAMTRSEIVFLTDALAAGLTADRILVAVSRLNLVEEDERDEVVGYVRQRAADISPRLTVVVLEGMEGVAAVRDWITGVVLPGLPPARRAQIGQRLVGCLQRVARHAGECQRAAETEVEARSGRLREAKHAHAEELLTFDEIREQVNAAQVTATDAFREQRDRFRAQLTRDLRHEIDRNPDPRTWWEKDLPYALETRLTSWDQQVRRVLHERCQRDLGVAAGRVSATFSLFPEPAAVEVAPAPDVRAPESPPLADLRQRRIMYRVGPPGVALVGVLAIPAIGPAIAIVASLTAFGLAEVKLRGLVEEQRAVIKRRLPGVVDGVLDTHAGELIAHLGRFYEGLGEELSRLRKQWRAVGPRLPEPGPAAGTDWASIAVAADDLINDIIEAAAADAAAGAQEAEQ